LEKEKRFIPLQPQTKGTHAEESRKTRKANNEMRISNLTKRFCKKKSKKIYPRKVE